MNLPPDLSKEIVLDSYENSLLRRMNELRKASPQESFCDASFDIDGKEFHCHKLVLISASPYFKAMFNGDYRENISCKNITMKGIEPEALEEILTAIYTTRFHLNRLNAFFILQASHMLHLTDIFVATERHIIEDPDIDFLIETCAFAKKVNRNYLYRKCVSAIASDLKTQSKTNSFLKEEGKAAIMTFDIFLDVLSNGNLVGDDEAVYQIIMKWCYFEKCSKEDVVRLLNASDIKSGCMNTLNLAKTIVQNYSDIEFGQITSIAMTSPGTDVDGSKKQTPSKGKRVSYNVYLNTVDVETGAKGWAHLQSQNEFKDFEVIHYEHSNSAYRKVKQIGKQLYCFEFDCKLKMQLFYYLENDEKTYLDPPPSASLESGYFDMEVAANSIYLITLHELWKYNLESFDWTAVNITQVESFCNPNYNIQPSQYENAAKKRPLDMTVDSLCPKLASDGDTLYIVGLYEWDIVRVSPNQQVIPRNGTGRLMHKAANPAVCCYENQIVVSGSNHDGNLHKEVSVYDTRADKWDGLKNMNTGRANHSLAYYNGVLYAIENRSGVWNEKYDTSKAQWIDFSPLPERFSVMQNQKRIELATCDVFNCSIK